MIVVFLMKCKYNVFMSTNDLLYVIPVPQNGFVKMNFMFRFSNVISTGFVKHPQHRTYMLVTVSEFIFATSQTKSGKLFLLKNLPLRLLIINVSYHFFLSALIAA